MEFSKYLKTLLFSGLFMCLFSISSYAQSAKIVAQVKEEITKTERVLTFQNIYGKNADDIAFFEDKVNRAKMRGLVGVKINPSTGLFTARFEKDIKKEDLDHFFQALGFLSYKIR